MKSIFPIYSILDVYQSVFIYKDSYFTADLNAYIKNVKVTFIDQNPKNPLSIKRNLIRLKYFCNAFRGLTSSAKEIFKYEKFNNKIKIKKSFFE